MFFPLFRPRSLMVAWRTCGPWPLPKFIETDQVLVRLCRGVDSFSVQGQWAPSSKRRTSSDSGTLSNLPCTTKPDQRLEIKVPQRINLGSFLQLHQFFFFRVLFFQAPQFAKRFWVLLACVERPSLVLHRSTWTKPKTESTEIVTGSYHVPWFQPQDKWEHSWSWRNASFASL